MDTDRIKHLLPKYLDNSISKAELEELFRAFETSGNQDEPFHSFLLSEWERTENKPPAEPVNWTAMYNSILANKPAVIQRRKSFYCVAAAAAAILVISVLSYLGGPKTAPIGQASYYANDIAPGTSKATLLLANDEKVSLPLTGKSKAALEGVVAADPRGLRYAAGTGSETPQLHTLLVPRGGQYKVTLSDGTQVWLNAASTLTYPVAFTGHQRTVKLTGEAYFEVVHRSRQPFMVLAGGQEIQDLGTHFTVSSYPGDKKCKVTLLQGAVKVSHAHSGTSLSRVLQPGQQALAGPDDIRVQNTDAAASASWTTGYFSFQNEDMESIMQQVGRWYNVEVSFQGDVKTKRFEGSISRFKNISELLKKFELTDDIHFKVEGRRVTVMN